MTFGGGTYLLYKAHSFYIGVHSGFMSLSLCDKIKSVISSFSLAVAGVVDITWLRQEPGCVEIYEISLRERVKYFSTRKEKFPISKRSCNVLFII